MRLAVLDPTVVQHCTIDVSAPVSVPSAEDIDVFYPGTGHERLAERRQLRRHGCWKSQMESSLKVNRECSVPIVHDGRDFHQLHQRPVLAIEEPPRSKPRITNLIAERGGYVRRPRACPVRRAG